MLFVSQIGREQMLYSGKLESVPEDIVPISERNLSSFSDVEILEQFDQKNNGASEGETSSPHSEKTVHVHFEDLNTSQDGGKSTSTHQVSIEHGGKECVVQPNKLGAGSGGGDSRGLLRATGPGGKQTPRNGKYGHRNDSYTESHLQCFSRKCCIFVRICHSASALNRSNQPLEIFGKPAYFRTVTASVWDNC